MSIKMKNLFLMISAGAVAAILLTGCDSRARLAKSLHGQWSGNPEILPNTGANSASLVRVMEFSPGTTAREGIVTMTAIITVENTMHANDSTAMSVQVTASGSAVITGMYHATDDDELIIGLDAMSLKTTIDPDGIQLGNDLAGNESSPSVEQLKPGAMSLANRQISSAAQHLYSNLTEIDDIHVRKSLMTCEIGNKKLTFSKSANDNANN